MNQFDRVDPAGLMHETEKFLNWMKDHKRDFKPDENANFIKILKESKDINLLSEKIRQIREQILHWIGVWWNEGKVGRTMKKHKRQNPRGKIIDEFPEKLKNYASVLDRVEIPEEEEAVDQITKEINAEVETCLTFMSKTEEQLIAEKKVKEDKDHQEHREKMKAKRHRGR